MVHPTAYTPAYSAETLCFRVRPMELEAGEVTGEVESMNPAPRTVLQHTRRGLVCRSTWPRRFPRSHLDDIRAHVAQCAVQCAESPIGRSDRVQPMLCPLHRPCCAHCTLARSCRVVHHCKHAVRAQRPDRRARVQESLAAGAGAAVAVAARHFGAALRCVRPSVSRADRVLYERLRDKLVASRSHIAAGEPPRPPPSAPPSAAAGGGTGTPAESGMEGVVTGDDPAAMAVDGDGRGADPMEM